LEGSCVCRPRNTPVISHLALCLMFIHTCYLVFSVFVVAMIGVLIGFFVLEETNKAVLQKNQVTQETVPLLQAPSDEELESNLEANVLPLQAPVAPQPKPMLVMVRDPQIALPLLLYTLVAFTYIQFDEVFALWARLPISEVCIT